MIASLDGPLLVMVEMPIDALESAGGFVFWCQGIIESQINRAVGSAVARLEISDDEFQQGQAQVVGVPGTDAEEVSEVAGINAWEFQGGELGQGLASWRHHKEVAEAFDVLALGNRQGQAQEADEGDNRRGPLYDSFHGGLRPEVGRWFGDQLPF